MLLPGFFGGGSCFVDSHLGTSWVFLNQLFAGGCAFFCFFGICHHCSTYYSLIPTDWILLHSLGFLWRMYLLQAALKYLALILSILPSLLLSQNLSLDTYSRHAVTGMLSKRRLDQLLSSVSTNTLLKTSLYLLWFAMVFGVKIKPWHCLDHDASKSPFMTRKTTT